MRIPKPFACAPSKLLSSRPPEDRGPGSGSAGRPVCLGRPLLRASARRRPVFHSSQPAPGRRRPAQWRRGPAWRRGREPALLTARPQASHRLLRKRLYLRSRPRLQARFLAKPPHATPLPRQAASSGEPASGHPATAEAVTGTRRAARSPRRGGDRAASAAD